MKMNIVKYLPLFATFLKTIMVTAKHDHKVRSFDKTKAKIDTIEHMLVKLEKKVGECRNEIENLRQQIMFSRVVNMVLLVLIIALILFLR